MARFRTRARTVEMLGRQQIAGIPNAISELFKNAHDAYATNVEVDFYRPERLLVLRDNGLGMTRDDVEGKWLVVGTESKVAGEGEVLSEVSSTLGMPPRTPTGEKGIGRLAIATIGPQVLLMTRARRMDGIHPLVACFINWSLFSLPGVALDEIEIPVMEFLDGAVPTTGDLFTMIDVVRHNLLHIRSQFPNVDTAEIDQQLNQVNFDAASLQERFQATSLDGEMVGTHFYIQPTDPMLEVSLDTGFQRREITDFERFLIGFTNTMIPTKGAPPITAAFRDHRAADLTDSLIGADSFFTPEEFESADHHFEGEFDEYGQFVGTVALYGGEPLSHAIPWPEARGRTSACGPFTIRFAYVQGAARESRIPRETWGRLMNKLSRMGGLYIYRNGIRILPYGNPDFDFINIEQRRTLGAQYYFFSYRRMFGAIELPTGSSDRLVEKAGREGFRDNRAYRDFRAILENFFIQLAADYFRDDAPFGEQYRDIKGGYDRQARARETHLRQSRARRRKVLNDLEAMAAKLNRDEHRERVSEVIRQLESELTGLANISDPDTQITATLRAEEDARRGIAEIRKDFRISVPRGVGLSNAVRRDLTAYRIEFAKIDKEVFEHAYGEIDAAVRDSGINVNRRRRFEAGVEATWKTAQATVSLQRRISEENLQEARDRIRRALREASTDFESKFGEISQRLQRTDLSNISDAEAVQITLDIDAEIDAVASEKASLFMAISQQLDSITVNEDSSGGVITPLDMMGAAEEELLALQERAEADLELTQLGMAIEIINHEFQATIRSVRRNLRRLRAWANVNEELVDVYNGIRVNFDHLDSYLTLFTPLHRRLYRNAVEIKGSEIGKFIIDLFRDRFKRHSIEIIVTRAFQRHRLTGYPSTFYPVFVNLVDNSVFWLQGKSDPRIIRLDMEDGAMIVADNGPGVSSRDIDAIFELGFTRKPGGRGLGLYISRDVLRQERYDLTIDEPMDSQGSVFRILPIEVDSE